MAARRSLSLAAYMAYARRAPMGKQAFEGNRPVGELVWAHATTASAAAALLQLAERLRAQRPGLHLLITAPREVNCPERIQPYIFWELSPDDTTAAAEAFLQHWRPSLCVWSGSPLQPALLNCAAKSGLPLFLVDADEHSFVSARWRWFPDLARASLAHFTAIFARNENAAVHLRKFGAPRERVSVTGPLQQGSNALFCDERTRTDLALSLAGRPIWMAAMAQLDELPIILRAHRLASRVAHRMLLIIVPDDPSQSAAFSKQISEDGWRIATWSEGEEPSEITQVLLGDTYGEMGLWYRLSPITLLASSLSSGHGGRDPFEPAALGSAILYGPNVPRFLGAYRRFANAGAARIVRDAETLSAAVSLLIAPDQAALMANAAWEVATEGAEVTDKIMDIVQDTLDHSEAS